MATLQEIKSALRERYAWPGGYPFYLLMSDGQALSLDAARENWRQIIHAKLTHDIRSEWHVEEVDINWEDNELVCAHSGEPIEVAYPG